MSQTCGRRTIRPSRFWMALRSWVLVGFEVLPCVSRERNHHCSPVRTSFVTVAVVRWPSS
jgi:hypothetical protein